jgi:hypothetical protein
LHPLRSYESLPASGPPSSIGGASPKAALVDQCLRDCQFPLSSKNWAKLKSCQVLYSRFVGSSEHTPAVALRLSLFSLLKIQKINQVTAINPSTVTTTPMIERAGHSLFWFSLLNGKAFPSSVLPVGVELIFCQVANGCFWASCFVVEEK